MDKTLLPEIDRLLRSYVWCDVTVQDEQGGVISSAIGRRWPSGLWEVLVDESCPVEKESWMTGDDYGLFWGTHTVHVEKLHDDDSHDWDSLKEDVRHIVKERLSHMSVVEPARLEEVLIPNITILLLKAFDSATACATVSEALGERVHCFMDLVQNVIDSRWNLSASHEAPVYLPDLAAVQVQLPELDMGFDGADVRESLA